MATFEEFLSEHWEIGIVLGYLQASNLAQQAAVVPCIDYPARTSEPNAQPFICLRKASYIADAVLGVRNEKAKERFLQVTTNWAVCSNWLEQDPSEARLQGGLLDIRSVDLSLQLLSVKDPFKMTAVQLLHPVYTYVTLEKLKGLSC